jgi:hypothetical protein
VDNAVTSSSARLDDNFEEVRLVSSGVRLIKAYSAENDSGEVEAVTFRRSYQFKEAFDTVIQNTRADSIHYTNA